MRDERQFELHLDGADGALRAPVPRPRVSTTIDRYLDANHEALAEVVDSQGAATGRWPAGVRVAPSASVAATATLVGPVYVGPGCEVAAGATVGPHVTVGPNCVIDQGAVVADAVVLPGTYVGEGVRLQSVVVDQDRIAVCGGDGADAVTCGVVGNLTDHLPARATAAVARWRDRTKRFVTRLRGVEKLFRRSVSEGLGAASQPGNQPEAVPVTTTD